MVQAPCLAGEVRGTTRGERAVPADVDSSNRETAGAPGRPLVVTADEVASALDRAALVDALAAAFGGGCEAPPRHHHTVPVPGEPDATMLLMPAWRPGAYLGVKIANVFPDNGRRDLPAVQASYLLFSGRTGQPLAVIDGAELTSRRTAAASSLAARHLARPESSRLLIVGTGEIARHLAPSHAAVRPIRTVEVWGRAPERAQALAAEIGALGFEARAADDLEAAVGRADIVSCCTLSGEPLVHGRWLRPGTHVDLIGGFTPAMREVDDEAIRRAVVYVDTPAAIAEAGDLVQPLRAGIVTRDAIRGDLANLVTGRRPGRTDGEEITLFKSVGASIEDLAAAILCVERRGIPPLSPPHLSRIS